MWEKEDHEKGLAIIGNVLHFILIRLIKFCNHFISELRDDRV